VVALEIVRVEKQKHAPAGLVAHGREFGGVFRLGQEQAAAIRPRPRWRDDYPALPRSARRVLNEPKPERAGVVGNGFVVVADDERNGGEGLVHGVRLGGGKGYARLRPAASRLKLWMDTTPSFA
jgi:hypothetical protein